MRVFVTALRDRDRFAPRRGRMDVDLDHAGIGRHLQHVEARIGRRRIAFDMNRQTELGRVDFDRGQEFEIVPEGLGRRHEDAQTSVARLDGQRGTHRSAVAICRALHRRAFRARAAATFPPTLRARRHARISGWVRRGSGNGAVRERIGRHEMRISRPGQHAAAIAAATDSRALNRRGSKIVCRAACARFHSAIRAWPVQSSAVAATQSRPAAPAWLSNNFRMRARSTGSSTLGSSVSTFSGIRPCLIMRSAGSS